MHVQDIQQWEAKQIKMEVKSKAIWYEVKRYATARIKKYVVRR